MWVNSTGTCIEQVTLALWSTKLAPIHRLWGLKLTFIEALSSKASYCAVFLNRPRTTFSREPDSTPFRAVIRSCNNQTHNKFKLYINGLSVLFNKFLPGLNLILFKFVGITEDLCTATWTCYIPKLSKLDTNKDEVRGIIIQTTV